MFYFLWLFQYVISFYFHYILFHDNCIIIISLILILYICSYFIFIYLFLLQQPERFLRHSDTGPGPSGDWPSADPNSSPIGGRSFKESSGSCSRPRAWSVRTFQDFLPPLPQLHKKWCSWNSTSPFTKLVDSVSTQTFVWVSPTILSCCRLLSNLSHFRLRPVWDLIAEVPTAGRFSLTSTWKPTAILATSPIHPSATPPTRSRSRRRGSGVSTPPATCSAPDSRGLVLACSPKAKDPLRGFLRPPRLNPPRASPPPPPPNVRLKVASLERGAISQARPITSACPSLPSLKRRTGSLWSQPSSWTRRRAPRHRTDWYRGHLRKLQWGAWAPKGPEQSGGRGGVRCREGCVLSLPADLQNPTTASRSSVCPRGCSLSPTRCDDHSPPGLC